MQQKIKRGLVTLGFDEIETILRQHFDLDREAQLVVIETSNVSRSAKFMFHEQGVLIGDIQEAPEIYFTPDPIAHG